MQIHPANSKFQVPRIEAKQADGTIKEIPFTIQRAHEVIAQRARDDIGIFFQFMTTHKPGSHQQEWNKAVLNNEKVMITCPRQFGKTDWAIMTLAWFMGHSPWNTNVIISVSGDVAKQRLNVLSLHIANNPRYKLVFPWMAIDPRKPWRQSAINFLDERMRYSEFSQRQIELGVDKTHSLLAASPDMNTLIGNRISGIALIDDLHDDKHINSPGLREKAIQFYESTYINCLTLEAKSIIIGTRWAADDIIGYIRSKIPLGGNYNYKDIDIPAERLEIKEGIDEFGNPTQETIRVATFPERFPMERLDKLRVSPRYDVDYMNKVASSEHSQFEVEKMKPLPEFFPEYFFEKLIISVDVAWTQNRDSDYSVIALQGIDKDQNYYLLKLVRSRFTLDQLGLNISREYHEAFVKYGGVNKVLIEEVGLQAISLQKRIDENITFEGIKLKGINKEARANKLQSLISVEKFHYDEASDWGLGFLAEMMEFPNGKHDDQVDAVTLGINYLYGYNRPIKSKLRMIRI